MKFKTSMKVKFIELAVTTAKICFTVNMVIFVGGKFRENVGKKFHVGVIFIILHKGILILFSCGGNFCEEDLSAKNTKISTFTVHGS